MTTMDADAIAERLRVAAADSRAAWEQAKAVREAFKEVRDRFHGAWMDATRRPDGSAGGIVPAHVLTCERALGDAEKRAQSALWSYQEVGGRVTRYERGRAYARICPDCGERALVLCQEAYYDVDRCCLCDYSETVRSIGD